MKRVITLYVVSFGVAIASFSLALASLLQPKWSVAMCSMPRVIDRIDRPRVVASLDGLSHRVARCTGQPGRPLEAVPRQVRWNARGNTTAHKPVSSIPPSEGGALLATRDDIIIRSEPKNLARSLSGDFVCLVIFLVYRIHFATPHNSPLKLSTHYGLFQRCDSSQWTGDRITCRRFPTRRQDCQAPGLSAEDKATLHSLFHDPASTPESTSELTIRPSALELQALLRAVPADTSDAWGFCDSWISAGYFQQLSLVLGFAAVIACFAAILTPLHSRRKPYRLISSLLFGHAVALVASTSLVAHEFNTSDRFVYGSRLAQSFIMSTTAWSLDVVVVAALVLVLGVLKVGDEGGYERIQN